MGEMVWGKAQTYMQNQRQTLPVPCMQWQPYAVPNTYKTYTTVKM